MSDSDNEKQKPENQTPATNSEEEIRHRLQEDWERHVTEYSD